MSEQQQEAPTFRTGVDFLNAHLNRAMSLVDLAASKNPDQLTAMMALELVGAHTNLAQVGAQVAVSESLNRIAAALECVAIQMQERTTLMRGEPVESPQDAPERTDDPMVAQLPERPL